MIFANLYIRFAVQEFNSIPPGTLPLPCHLAAHTAASYPERLRSFTKENLMQLALQAPDLKK